MCPRLAACLVALLALVAAPVRAERACGTFSSPEDFQQAFERTTNASGQYLFGCLGGGTILVAFHVVHSGATGMVSAATVNAQMAELNANFAPSGYNFVLASLDYTDNAAWFNLSSSADELAMKTALAIDPAHRLNLYTTVPTGFFGFAYYPWAFPENSPEHAVLVDHRTLPGGSAAPFNLGRTATHEVGHYLGLAHTFQGGCLAPGDFVDDTPAEAAAQRGCPIGANTCPSPGLDPIHNYMDYTDDACYLEFTAGQMDRMCTMVASFRPNLLNAGSTPVRRGTWGELKVRYR